MLKASVGLKRDGVYFGVMDTDTSWLYGVEVTLQHLSKVFCLWLQWGASALEVYCSKRERSVRIIRGVYDGVC